jgi:hypothetical protein
MIAQPLSNNNAPTNHLEEDPARAMKISGEFQAKDWPSLRSRLKADEAKAWEEAVEMLKQRLSGRYLEQARALLDRPYSGFSVLAIDCAVVEALEQFRQGEPETPYKESEDYFKNFLTRGRFNAFFSKDDAGLFYHTVRCGILHQAESKEDTLVKKSPASFVVQTSPSGKGLIINARRFHEELEGALEDYATALMADEGTLRTSFIKKMNYVARVQSDAGGVV